MKKTNRLLARVWKEDFSPKFFSFDDNNFVFEKFKRKKNKKEYNPSSVFSR